MTDTADGMYFTRDDITGTARLREVQDRSVTSIIHLLDKLRQAFGHPIRVNSGYRSPNYNASIGGAKTSYHMFKGARGAVDISPWNEQQSSIELLQTILDIDMPFSKMISAARSVLSSVPSGKTIFFGF